MMSSEICKSKHDNLEENPGYQQAKYEVVITEKLYSELTRLCLDALPHKAYGLIGGPDKYHPRSLYPCSSNLRNTPEWKAIFDSFGEFHKNPDVGFVISPSEVRAVINKMSLRGESPVGVFHSHRFLSVEPSKADIALSSASDMLCYIISVSSPPVAEVGVFSLGDNCFRKIPIVQC